MATKKPWVPAHELAFQELLRHSGSINRVAHGRLVKTGREGVWDMERPWEGAELTSFKAVLSNWSKGWVVRFIPDERFGSLVTFTLSLAPPPLVTKEDAEQIASTYMVLLNLRRLGNLNKTGV